MSDARSALEALAAQLAGGADVPAAVRHAVTLHIADTVAAWIAGARTAEGRMLIAFRDSMRQRAAGVDSVLLDVATHCAVARLSEIDDIHLASMTTPGAIVIPTALTVAVANGIGDPQALTEAILAGYEALTRLGAAIDGPTVLYRGIWPSYFGAPFATAAVSARLLGLNVQETAYALALALTLASPGVGHHNAATTSRWFAVGNAARNGVTAALAAQSGFTSDIRMLDGAFLPNIFGFTPKVAALTDGLGGRAALIEVSFKPWCAARQTMAATQGIKEIMQVGVVADDMTTITAHVLPPHLKMIDHGVTAGDRASHLTSLPYQMALAACAPEAASDVGQSPGSLPAPVAAFMQKIKVVADEGLLTSYPKAWPARVVAETRSGRLERAVSHVPGDPERAFSDADVREKFLRFTAPLLQDDGAEEALRLCLGVFDDSEGPTLLLRDIEQAYADSIADAQ